MDYHRMKKLCEQIKIIQENYKTEPMILAINKTDVQVSGKYKTEIAPLEFWEIKERSDPNYPFEASVIIEGVKFFCLVNDHDIEKAKEPINEDTTEQV